MRSSINKLFLKKKVFNWLFLIGTSIWVLTATAQPAIRPRIYGQTALQTPGTASYSVLPAEGYEVSWRLLGSGATFNSPPGSNPMIISFLGRGDNLLIASIRNVAGQLQFDTLRIRRNTCSAVVGNLGASRSQLCAGESVRLQADDLLGIRTVWQRLEPDRGWQTFDTRDRQPLGELLTQPLLATTEFRVIVQNAVGCADTSHTLRVRVQQRPQSIIGANPASQWCSGQSTGSLQASARHGLGEWVTTGTGVFSRPYDGMSDYIPSDADAAAGRVRLIWRVTNDLCPKAESSIEQSVFFSPRSEFEGTVTDVCPEGRSVVLRVRVTSGTGRWVPPPNALGQFVNPRNASLPFDPTFPQAVFVPHRDDGGKRLQIGWLATNGSCDTLLTRELVVRNPGVARIAYPATPAEAIVCEGDPLRLRADTSGRRGSYLWGSNQPFAGSAEGPFPLAQPTRDSALYILTYIDLLTNCRTRDSVVLRLRQRGGGFAPARFETCPDQPLLLRVRGVDTTQGAGWTPRLALSDPDSPIPFFQTSSHDTTYRYTLQARSEIDGCIYRTSVDIRVLRAPAPVLVDLNRRPPERFCYGYPNSLFFRDTVGCELRWIFAGSIAEVLANGELGPDHPNYLASSSLKVDSLAVRLEPYVLTSVCLSAFSGCLRLHESRFRMLEVPVAAFEPDKRQVPFNNRQVRFINRSERATNYSWDFGDPSLGSRNNSQQREPVHEFPRPGRFVVSLVADNGVCSKATFNEIEVRGEDYYFPEAFSPDGDGLNDLFRPLPAFWSPDLPDASDQLRRIRIRKFEIMDLSQNIVYEVHDAKQWQRQLGWDGTTPDGRPADPGVYLYRLIIDQEPYGSITHTGRVTLIR